MRMAFVVIKYLKVLAGIILLFSIFLPFSSCTRIFEENHFQNVPSQDSSANVNYVFTEQHGQGIEAEDYESKYVIYILSSEGWRYSIAYIWPFIILYLSTYSAKVKAVAWSIESIFSILGAYLIIWGSFPCPEIGAYISFFSNLSILILWIIEFGLLVYIKYKYKNLTSAYSQTGVRIPLHTGW